MRGVKHWAAAIVGGLGLCLSAGLFAASAQEKITILLDYSFPEGIHASLHLADVKGWYKEAGLDVEIQDGKGSIVTLQQVAAGQADIGLANLPATAAAVANGLPVTSIMAFTRSGDNGLIVGRDSGINKLADFKGKKLVSIAGGAVGPFIDPFFKAGGLAKDAYTTLIVDGSALMSTYASGNADGVVSIAGYFLPAVEKMRPSKAILFSDVGLTLPGYGLVVRKDTLEKRAAALAKVVEINQRAWNYIRQGHEEEAADAIVKQKASLKPDREAMLGQIKIYDTLLDSPATKGKPIGWQSEAEWDKAIEIMASAGVVKAGLKGKDVFTNQFVK